MFSTPDFARLQPTSDSLNIILKNTNFPDNILDEAAKINLEIKYYSGLTLLFLKFSQPYHDFFEILTYQGFRGSQMDWLDKNPVIIKLVMSDTVITDKLTTREFELDTDESIVLRTNLIAQKSLTQEQIKYAEEYIYSNLDKFLK
ncbi:hypothetical protein [Dyadobacter psychrotolerans]|uniref:Uncharacterized protein n=1 Tax=Dyadobacter psychrotolerans TaxID=2541721 RepID=A0A4R5DXH4_9BACT|nr:hypothetical protein [Dyadobacter psychrotolerans]TDE17160.1 hypothetical protein E0F88_04475 [Dyadobacter psychrotolerans]